MMRSLAFLVLPFATALVLDTETWGPSDSVHALDAVITAVNSIVKNPHLSPEHLTKAKKVVEDIKADIEAVETGHLTKLQTNQKVGQAIAELSAFEADFAVQKDHLVAGDKAAAKIAKLQQELAEKKKALAKEESMMKLLKLKKALAEKKLMLEKLMMQKAEAASGKKSGQELSESNAVVTKLLKMAAESKNVTKGAKGELPAPLKAIEDTLQQREHVVSDSMAKILALQSKGDAQIEAVLKSQSQDGKSTDNIKKSKMFKHMKTQEDRKFAKARAVKQHELDELKEAEKSTQERDVNGLMGVLSKMQRENRQLQAKSGDFLH